MKYLLDTCVFNWLLDGTYSIEDLPAGDFVITHIQRDEIEKTKDKVRRAELLRLLKQVADTQVRTEVFVLGVSRLGQAALGNGDIYHQISTELAIRTKRSSNLNDAIIGATAHASGHGLVTADLNFFEVMKKVIPNELLVFWHKSPRNDCQQIVRRL